MSFTELLEKVETLTSGERKELLAALQEAEKQDKRRAEQTENQNGDKPFKTIFDIAPQLVGNVGGKHDNLPSDLSSNKKISKKIWDVINPTIADTGPIVSFLSPKDKWHAWTISQMRSLPAPYLTCEAVIVEACFLMKSSPDGEQDVLSLVESGILQIDFSLSAEISAVKKLMKKYEDVPMDFADACLVRISENIENSIVFTLDSDFCVYRKNGKEPISLIIPSSN